MKLRFLHIADIHLDGFIKGQNLVQSKETSNYIRTSALQSFERAITYAINEKLDFIIIAGDFFHGTYRSVTTYQKVLSLFEQLHKQNIKVYITYGNHDFIESQPIAFPFPESVEVFSEAVEKKVFIKRGFPPVSIVGFSYPYRHLVENMVGNYPVAENNEIAIGILHGAKAQTTDHDTYAPFTVPELLQKKYTYWALGHIHKREVLHEQPYIVYPGNIQGRHKKEYGEKGGYVVTIDTEKQTSVQFVPFSDVIWKEVIVDATDTHSIYDLLKTLQQTVAEVKKEKKNFLLFGKVEVGSQWFSEEEWQDCISAINEKEGAFPFALLANFTYEAKNNERWDTLKDSLPFFKTLDGRIDEMNVSELAAPFVKYTALYNEIEQIISEKEEEWKNQSKSKIVSHMFE